MTFGPEYSSFYDAFYESKDYGEECRLIQSQIQKYLGTNPCRIIDIGCGTGSHTLLLTKEGHQVTGVDRSPHMLELARRKCEDQEPTPDFVQQDVRELDLATNADVALMMFAVLSYQKTNEDLDRALSALARHVRPGGLLMGDIWYGPGVTRQQPGQRISSFTHRGKEVLRVADGHLDSFSQTCTVKYTLWGMGENGPERSEEEHRVRYFFPQELRLALSCHGFEILELTAFPDTTHRPTDRDWNAFFVARRMERV